jgi:hypothetical protein
LKLFNTVYNENVPQKWWIKKIKKKGRGVHKSGPYVFNGLEHTAILSNFLTFITGSSSRVSTIHTTFWLTSLLQIYELKRRYKTTRLRNVLHPSRLLRIRFSADLTMYWFPVYHFRCKEFKPLVIWKILLFLPLLGLRPIIW